MLSNLRKMIDAELENDSMIDMMLEASNSIADMFIEDDGEAEIDESEILNILNKIPEYDEEKELNKKLDRIAESCIPEDVEYLNESVKDIMMRIKRSFSKSGRAANINDKHLSNLRKGMVNSLNNENDIEELKAYKKWILDDSIAWNEETLAGMDDENQKEVMRNHIDWLKKFVNKIDKKIAKLEKNPVEINKDEYEGRY